MKNILTLCALAICGAFSLQAAEGDKPKKPGAGDAPRRNPEEVFKKLDTNADGSLSKDEYLAAPFAQKDKGMAEKRFGAQDKDKDGKLSKQEFAARGDGGRKRGEGDKPGAKKPEGDKPAGKKPEGDKS